MAKVKCSECGRLVENPHYINGKPYGYSCYKQKLALIYKQWEDEKNAEYSAKCFAAMQIFQGKKSNSFHDSICKQGLVCDFMVYSFQKMQSTAKIPKVFGIPKSRMHMGTV